MGIDPEGAVDFVNLILSDCQPVQRIEDLTEEAYQTLLSRFREMKREREKSIDEATVAPIWIGKLTPKQEKERLSKKDQAMEDYRARKYAGLTPEEIKEKDLRIFERMCDEAENDRDRDTGFYRKPTKEEQ
jgi:hypothetical protein